MRLIFVALLLSVLGYADLAAQNLPQIKKAMLLAVEDDAITDSLYKELTALNSKDPLIWAYIATLDGLKAKHSWNPYNKLKFVSRSQKLIAKAVTAKPEDLEIRFMRFSLQHYTPEFLGFSKNLKEDREVIFSLYEQRKFGRSDQELVRNIAKFMIDSQRCTPKEILLFKKFLSCC
jgi:hypothetical protein